MTDVKAELLPHEFTGPIVNGQHICKWCSGTPNECSYVFGPYCDKRPQPSPKVDGLVEALAQIQLLASNHGGWVENDPQKLVGEIHEIATAALKSVQP